MKYQNLFSKGKIGNLTIKNRIVMPAMGTALASSTGDPSAEIIRYYEERAKGGCGLIITEITRVDDENGVGTFNQLSVTKLARGAGLERLARTVHKYDAKIFLQLHHPGRESHTYLNEGRPLVAPSAVACKVCKEMPKELTTAEVEALVKKFVMGAKIAQNAGIDGVELHGAHGYLIGQFLSPYTNKRTDKYGGHFANRMRFITEIIMGIKHVCGASFPISVRISGDEFIEGGNNLEEGVKISKYLESIGVDAINVSCGIYESAVTIIEPISYPQGWKKHLAQAIKAAVKIPVIAVDVIRKPDFAENLLAEGNLDFVAIGRGQLADPEWGIKAQEGREEEIRPCISCLHCIEELEKGGNVKCAVNARLGREIEFNEYKKDGDGKVVAVIGAGPAGLEASRVLALRGFKVVLFEKEKEIGGMLALGNKPPHKEKITWLIENFDYQLKQLGVEVRLGKAVTVEEIKALNPYAVFVATGTVPIIPKIEGIDSKNVYTISDILSGAVKFSGENAVVIGAGMTGCETAEYLAEAGNKVSLVEMAPGICTGMYPSNIYNMMGSLKKYGVELLLSHKLDKISGKEIALTSLATKEAVVKAADRIVLSLGVKSENSLVSALEENFKMVRVIGDAKNTGRIAEAVRDGFEKAFVL